MSPNSVPRIPIHELTDFSVKVLRRTGIREEDARTTADALVQTDSMGIFTHGTHLLPGYVRRIRGGGLRTDTCPEVVREGPAWALVDGNSTLGQVTSTFAMKTAIEKARSAGVGYVGVRNSCHFGAAGYYAWLAAREEMIGLAMANDHPTVAAPGSRKAVTGSNPLAYAIPTGTDEPVLLDISIGTVAGGKVYAAQRQNRPIPDNWIIGPDGRPSTEASLFPHSAALAPMAGHKGYGLALLIETLAAVLTGAAVTWEVENWITSPPSRPTRHGAAFVAVRIESFLPFSTFRERLADLAREIHEAPTADGVERIFLPGEMEWERRRQAIREGVPLPGDTVSNLAELARDLGLECDPFREWEESKDE